MIKSVTMLSLVLAWAMLTLVFQPGIPCGEQGSLDSAAPPIVHLLVRVPAAALSGRSSDQGPAQIELAAEDIAPDQRFDLASLEVQRCDPETGKALCGPLPLRWYDAAIPYEFP